LVNGQFKQVIAEYCLVFCIPVVCILSFASSDDEILNPIFSSLFTKYCSDTDMVEIMTYYLALP